MRDLLAVVPSRGRPQDVRRFMRAAADTARADTAVVFCLDDDDPLANEASWAVREEGVATVRLGSRRTQVAWANLIAVPAAAEFSAVALLSDDNVPRTEGWDKAFVTALSDPGVLMANAEDLSGNGGRPSHIVMSGSAVHALGWIAEPSMSHYFIDNVWEELGRRTGCLRYLPGVIIDHVWRPGRAPADKLREEELAHFSPDRRAWEAWLDERADADAEKLRACQ